MEKRKTRVIEFLVVVWVQVSFVPADTYIREIKLAINEKPSSFCIDVKFIFRFHDNCENKFIRSFLEMFFHNYYWALLEKGGSAKISDLFVFLNVKIFTSQFTIRGLTRKSCSDVFVAFFQILPVRYIYSISVTYHLNWNDFTRERSKDSMCLKHDTFPLAIL